MSGWLFWFIVGWGMLGVFSTVVMMYMIARGL
jgi:hypothetical protein